MQATSLSHQLPAGLRLVSVALPGFWQLPWELWLPSQLAVVALAANLEVDCNSRVGTYC